MLKKDNKKPTLSQRQLRVGELIKKSLSDFLQKDAIHDPELQSISITITQVMLSPDLKKANAYIIPLGGDNTETIVQTGIEDLSNFSSKYQDEKKKYIYHCVYMSLFYKIYFYIYILILMHGMRLLLIWIYIFFLFYKIQQHFLDNRLNTLLKLI